MVYFMTKNHRQKALYVVDVLFAVSVLSLHRYGSGALHRTVHARKAQTGLHVYLAAGALCNDGVYQFVKDFLVAAYHHHSFDYAHQSRSTTNSVGSKHGFFHVVYQDGEVLVKLCYFSAFFS